MPSFSNQPEEFSQLELHLSDLDDLSDLGVPADEVAATYRKQHPPGDRPLPSKHEFSLRVKDLPESERPRTRLLQSGAGNLSTSELLSVLLGTGQGAGELSAIGLAHRILSNLSQAGRNPLETLRTVTAHELMQIHGIGVAKAATILAAIELGKRAYTLSVPLGTVIDEPGAAATVLAKDLMYQPVEKFAVVMLDVKNRLIGQQIISVGTADETFACPREIFKTLLKHGATRAIIAHSHPSGVTEPSPEDWQLTRKLLQAAQMINLPLLDHLILGKGTFTSIRQMSGLWHEFPQE